jgi:hypothetical protein
MDIIVKQDLNNVNGVDAGEPVLTLGRECRERPV